MQTNYPIIEVHSFKWPRHPVSVASLRLLGEDRFGRWLGVRRGDPWWSADGSQRGVFERPLVKLVPEGTYWTACFHPIDPVIDVDIVLPVQWVDGTLEEVDLELDILGTAGGHVYTRDQDEFARVRKAEAMPDTVAQKAQTTCTQIYGLITRGVEPFHSVGREWLARFLVESE